MTLCFPGLSKRSYRTTAVSSFQQFVCLHDNCSAVTWCHLCISFHGDKGPRSASFHAEARCVVTQVTTTALINTHSSTAASYFASPPLSHAHSMTSMFIIMSTFTARSQSGRRAGSFHDQKAGMLLCTIRQAVHIQTEKRSNLPW